jgi:hypothetical protein
MEQSIMMGEKSMPEQLLLTASLGRVHLPLWKRLTLVTTLLLSAGAIAPVTCFAHHGSYHHHHHNRYIANAQCVAGDGGDGGIAIGASTGGSGGPGGDCVIGGAKAGSGGIQGAGSSGAGGGNIIYQH